MKLSDRSIKIEYQDIIAFLITILLTSFPIFGQYGMTIQKYGLWILGILGFLITILKGWISFNRILVGYAFYFLFSIISILWCVDLSSAYIRIMDMFKVLLIGCFIVSYCKKESNIQKFLSFYVFGTAFISIYCFIQDVSTFSSWSRLGKIAFEKAGQNQIYYSCILIYSVIIILYRMFESKNNKVFYMILFAFLYGCGLLTAVRKCLVIPVVFAIFYVSLKYKKHALQLIGYFVLAVVLGGLGYYIITKYVPSMYSRIQSFIFDLTTGAEANISGNSYELRKWLREQAWNQFINNPVIGVGIGQFRYYARAGGSDLYSHNNFLEILANTGIIGFILYYGNLFLLLFQAKKTSDRRYGKEISKGYFIMGFLLSMFIMEYGQVDYYQIYFISILVVMSNLVDNFRLTCCIKPRTKFRYKKMTGGSNN